MPVAVLVASAIDGDVRCVDNRSWGFVRESWGQGTDMSDEQPTIKRVNRQVIANQALVALNDRDKVAIIATADDLRILIDAMAKLPDVPKYARMLSDLQALHDAAFSARTGGEPT